MLLALLVPPRIEPAGLQSGDILLQTSQTSQAIAIAWATGSRWTHVGLVDRENGALAVIEAVQPVRHPARRLARARR